MYSWVQGQELFLHKEFIYLCTMCDTRLAYLSFDFDNLCWITDFCVLPDGEIELWLMDNCAYIEIIYEI